MVIEKLSLKAVQFYRAASRTAAKGSNYVSNSLIDLLSGHTQVGKRIAAGVRQARISARNKMMTLVKDETGVLTRYMGSVETNGSKVAGKAAGSATLTATLRAFDTELAGTCKVKVTDSTSSKNDEAQLKDAFARFGVQMETYHGDWRKNEYWIGGKSVDRDKAWEHVYRNARR